MPAFVTLAVASIGVVYGDIGTSPIYALRESLAHAAEGVSARAHVIGVVSLILWSLIVTVTLKYVLFIMRADNRGEGGMLSLMALAQGKAGRGVGAVFWLGMVGAALFCGDAVLTPAVSVLSAVEGLKLITPVFDPYIVPATLAILIVLLFVQKWGTHAVAALFGPVMLVWFAALTVMGFAHIGDAPAILKALDPLRGVRFLMHNGFTGFTILGSVFLAVTGAEALYADMGHLGRRPIQAAWLFFAFPALVINYMGQGAMILANPETAREPFFLMAPDWGLAPLVVLSTLATVIASQAVITGAFSLAQQAIQLGLLPRMEIRHTCATQEGEIYMPRINHFILLGVIILVATFRSSSALANAYGIAVSGTMVATTALAFIVARRVWGWPLWRALAVTGLFLAVDLVFLAANLIKVLDGGYVPLVIGAAMALVMVTWVRGARLLERKTHRDSIPLADLIRMLERKPPPRVPGTAIFLTSDIGAAPSSLMHNLKHNKALHERVIVMCVKTESVPRVCDAMRYETAVLSPAFTAVTLHYGYMEQPRIPAALAAMRKAGLKFDIMTTSIFLGRRTIKAAHRPAMPLWQDKLFIALSKQASPATDFFAIPSDRVVELGAQVVI